MARFRKKPVVVEAIQFSGDNTVEIAELLGWECTDGDHSESIIVETLEGDVTANVGDWVIRGVMGEGYPCRDDIFRLAYDPVDAEEP